MKQLLSIDTNPKTIKGQKRGFMTGVMYLAPSDLSGYQVCPMAKQAKCEEPCLNKAGRGAFNSIQRARINKTIRFFEDRENFMLDLVKSIEALIRKAARENLVPLVRLNGTSDIRWEHIRFKYTFAHNKIREISIFELFPEIQFYDYTKIVNRSEIPKNYDLTFSYSGVVEFQPYVKKAIARGDRIAAVFRKQEDIPNSFLGLQCVDGDDSDLRHADPKGVIVALYAKGKAKKDSSGFVIDKAA
jgi:hypothetical protein